ncbi:MAG TPA: hypothetical protein VIK54_16805, partial [Acidimicrobiia bacterium]
MLLDRSNAIGQAASDLYVGVSECNIAEHFGLLGSEVTEGVVGASGVPVGGECDAYRRVEVLIAARDGAYRLHNLGGRRRLGDVSVAAGRDDGGNGSDIDGMCEDKDPRVRESGFELHDAFEVGRVARDEPEEDDARLDG